jgi:energy-coupling factor transport system permease protein
MAIPLPFGNYLALDTPVHRVDARIKLLLVVLYVFMIFMCRTWVGLLAAALILVILFSVARIPVRLALRGLTPVWFILIFTFLANALTLSAVDPATVASTAQEAAGGSTVENLTADIVAENAAALARAHVAEQQSLLSLPWLNLDLGAGLPQSIPLIGSFGIRPLGVVKGLYFALRISLLVLVTSLLTYTTSIISLTDAISRLLSPLRALRAPVEDIAMVFSIALRFIPLTALEAEKLMLAQSARGARFGEGGPIKRVRAWVPVLVPLFVNLFRRADHLAEAMESRCYVGAGRTLLVHVRLTSNDVVWAVAGSVLLISFGLLL